MTSRRRSLSHPNGCVTNNSPRDSISAHIFLVGSREGLVLDILQVLSGISGVPPSPNFNQLTLQIQLKMYQEAIAKHSLQAHAIILILFFDSILRHWLFSCFISILCLSIVLSYVHLCILSSVIIYS